ncbi:CUE domain-containing protein 2-B-like [Dreissena polymorpha]|uniref:CUE domain-containing protein 2 n=1 Tax=Dreissena polymorpha TaxID=45954 RepID=A0A9D4CHJ4_DREPO|nr:CUE domain-containing protein 2-B-like [Dreissena polymorpha]XP_052244034.1 CUE domain-containing protein 2-B-like [Dreissena polymorpha]KAH3724628.1 hypothetical protein DPMN_050450 [Dreissena polymorpha]
MTQQGESRVQEALAKFLRKHKLEERISDVDGIVLQYVLSILEDLGDGSGVGENIDVDQFVEVMDAYIPGFGDIDSVAVCDWMFELASKMSQGTAPEPTSPTVTSDLPMTSDLVQGACSRLEPETRASRCRNAGSAGDSERSSSESSSEDIDAQVDQLSELFPDSVRLELEHCVRGAGGDLEGAVQLVLTRHETGASITQDKKPKVKRPQTISQLDDKKAKEMLMERYAFIDVNEDKKQYKPKVPKAEPKKLVRYLDNQVVNTKGQKFTEIKTEESEEAKNTYINLKPAKKYRFH